MFQVIPPRQPPFLKHITDVLDYELNVESGITGSAHDNYEGQPDGESGFDWRKC